MSALSITPSEPQRLNLENAGRCSSLGTKDTLAIIWQKLKQLNLNLNNFTSRTLVVLTPNEPKPLPLS